MRISLDAVRNVTAKRTLIRAVAISGVFLCTIAGAVLASSTPPLKGTSFANPFVAGVSAFTVTGLLLALAALGGARSRRTDVDELRLTVRTLEDALEEQLSLGVAQTVVHLELGQTVVESELGQTVVDLQHERARARADESQRILLAIEAMREATDFDAAAEHVLNRVEAAVTRLSASSSIGRPTLPARVARARVSEQPPPKEVGPLPVKEARPSPVTEVLLVPVREARPSPVTTVLPVPVQDARTLPVREARSVSVRQARPSPVTEVRPSPVTEVLPVPVREARLSPVTGVLPVPVSEARPSPVREAAPSPLMSAGAPVLPVDIRTVLPVPAPAPEPQAVRDHDRRFRRDRGRHSNPPFAFRGRDGRRSVQR